MEGLHALYDQLRRYMDLKIYVDPSREVKRMWKIKRDVEERGYRMEDVVEEMRKREPYYKRYIDFQKIYADIVIKIGISQFNEKNSYFVESIMKKIDFPLSGIEMPLSISSLTNSSRKPMMISYRNDFYYMKNVSRLVFDGLIPHSSIDSLERRIMEYTRFENFIIERSEYVREKNLYQKCNRNTKMEKDRLLRDIRELLMKEEFEIGEPILKSISFDMIARKEHTILILKALVNIDALRAEVARELKILGKELNAAPLVIGKRCALGSIMDDVVYTRHGVSILSFNTFKNFIINGEYPMVYASPGGFYVNINGWLLRKLRETRGISLGELAKVAGVSRKAIQLYEEGMSATVDSALRLEEYLKVPLIEPINIMDPSRLEEERYPKVKDEIYRKLMEIGYDVFLTLKCPFEAISKDEMDIFLTSVSKNKKRIRQKAINLRIMTHILNKNAFIIVEGMKHEEIEGIPLIEKDELMEIERKEDIRSIVRERSVL